VPVFFPNFAAEERDEPPPSSWSLPVLAALDVALRACCSGDRAFGAIASRDVVVAWLNTPGAARFAATRGLPLYGAAPDVVDIVHDKAFCVDVVRRAGLLPTHLDACIHIVDARDVDDERLLSLAVLPDGVRAVPHRGFTAKPRRGSSGRGRVDLRNASAVRGALARLRAAGGVVVEPWLQRTVDVAAAWLVDDDGAPVLLGTSRADVSSAGVWRGCEVVVDAAGVPRADHRHERALVEQSRVVVAAAAARGYRGPCGVDAFAFVDHDGVERLRVVELNARFTGGLLGVVLAAGRAPGSRFRFAPSTSAELETLAVTPTSLVDDRSG
jgi:hypothetical protein